LSRKKVGLALGGGAARGLAHIGVLEGLEKEGIPVDMVAGTSMGALVGALYARERDVGRIRNLALELGSKRFAFLMDPALPKTGLVRGRKIADALRSAIGDVVFRDLRIPFACVATDIDSGEEVVIREGSVWEGVRASSSIPALLAVAKRDSRYLVDGGLVNPVPVSVLKAMEADLIIAVNVMPLKSPRAAKEPNIFTILMQAFYISANQIVKSSLGGADIVIEPRVEPIGLIDFHRVEECIQLGVLATEQAIPEIRKLAQG